MKVTAFIGSARKKHTYQITERFLQRLQTYGQVDYEIIQLSDYDLKPCIGCMLCLNKGEELCPLKDDRDVLIIKMHNSDGIILASPNYSFNVSGLMKIFLDRLGYVFHRPAFFGKTFTSITVQGFYGGNKIIQYFNFLGEGLGFNVIKGCCLNSLEPMTDNDQKITDKIIDRQSRKYFKSLVKKEYPTPTLFKLMIFRMSRTSIRLLLNNSWRDYEYYSKRGWFTSDYYYPTRLNMLKRFAGSIFDSLFKVIYSKKSTELQTIPAL